MLLFGMECSKVLLHGDKAFWKVKIMRVSSIGKDLIMLNSWEKSVFEKFGKSYFDIRSNVAVYFECLCSSNSIRVLLWRTNSRHSRFWGKSFYYITSPEQQSLLQPKVNIDKVRYEWGGCIYAGWCISSLEIISS